MRKLPLFVVLVFLCAPTWSRDAYRDYLPNLPATPPSTLESDQEFLSRCRDEEAYFFTKHTGLFYSTALYQAAHGDVKALASLFEVAPYQDGAGAEGFAGTLFWMMHRVGDEEFSNALALQPKGIRQRTIDLIDFGATYDYSATFPKTFRLARHRPI